jgi:1-deoxy-D-xylulose-5-phosphate synthase
VFDLAYLRCIPELVVMAPRDEAELVHMMATALAYDEGPIAYRYPRGNGLGVPLPTQGELLPIGKGVVLEQGSQILLLGLGTGVILAAEVAGRLREHGIEPTVVDARFLKPLDEELLLQQAARHELVCTFEEGTEIGGFGSAVLELFHRALVEVPTTRIFGLPDRFLEHGTPEEVLADAGLEPESIALTLHDLWSRRERTIDFHGRNRA